jgi:hypothetical protein
MCRVRTISRKGPPASGNPQRLHASHLASEVKIQSGLHGDVERSAEMIDPLGRVRSSHGKSKAGLSVTDTSEIPCRVSINTCPAVSREAVENRLISGKPSLPQWQRAIPREVLVTP